MKRPDLSAVPDLELRDGEPVFAAPWEARAFALTVTLYERGHFSWSEWADALSAEIHSGSEREYYEHWLAALEKISTEKTLTDASKIDARQTAWQEAAGRTPHGQPITLEN